MSIFDSAKEKIQQLAEDNPDKVEQLSDQAIERGGDAIDSATGGRFAEHVDTAQAKGDEAVGQG
ncbi:MAG: antitoxin [Dermatophilaceae bacterium]